MVDMLVDEEARQEENTTGVCMEYFLKNGILQYLVNVSEKTDYPEGIRGEAIRTIASMVDLLDDRFLVHNAVHKPTIKLLRYCVLDDRQSDTYHEDLVDLMYIICSKIHGFPALLNIFFHDKQWLTTPQKAYQHDTTAASTKNIGLLVDQANTTTHHNNSNNNSDKKKKPEYEFLLFTYLLRFVHREGRSGDFARTGLLFLMEMATNQLGDFILGSDFATIMAAGLGALYSQLPRKLVIKDDAEFSTSPATFLLGQDLDPRANPSGMGVGYSNSDDFKLQLDSFLKLFEFCQDVLLRCPNAEISRSLLQNIRSIFLTNILYPSILECSDIDGSSVAVITYIDLILQTLQQEDLADLVVKFLMDDENDNNIIASTTETSKVFSTKDDEDDSNNNDNNNEGKDENEDEDNKDNHKKNAQSNVFAGIEFDQFKSSPYFTAAGRFTLKDLIIDRLKSSSQPTVIATLKLLKTLITKHCRYGLKLLSIIPDDSNSVIPSLNSEYSSLSSQQSSMTIISHHIREIELYFSLITAIDQAHSDDILSVGYEEYLYDIESHMEVDWCYQNMAGMNGLKSGTQITRTPKAERRRSFKYGRKPEGSKYNNSNSSSCQLHKSAHLFRHKIRPTDPLLQILLGLLSHFFAQSSALNLALTGVISALALCPYRSLEGWISFQESDRTTPDDILILNSSNITTGTTTTSGTGTGSGTVTSASSSTPTTIDSNNTADQLQELHLDDANHNNNNGFDTKIKGNDIYAHFEYNQVNEDDEDDDRSVDFGIERNLSHSVPVTQFKSFPPFFTLFRTLTQQVDYYRSEIDGFDLLLKERWQALMFGDVDPSSSLNNSNNNNSGNNNMMNSGITSSMIPNSISGGQGYSAASSPVKSRRGSFAVRQDGTSSTSSSFTSPSLFFGTTSPNSGSMTSIFSSSNTSINSNNNNNINNNNNDNNSNIKGDFGLSGLGSRRPSILRMAPSSSPQSNPASTFGFTSSSPSTLFHQQQQQYLRRKKSNISNQQLLSSNMNGQSYHQQPPNPSKSLSSSTTAAAMAAATRSTPTPLTLPNNPTMTLPNHHLNNPTVPIILNNPLSPLAIHARSTLDTRIQPLFPSNFITEPEEHIVSLSKDDEDTFAPKSTNPSQSRRLDKSTEITLSMLLNNVVILEETIKELVAIMQIRRSNGIDRVSYL
ncbi:unnamed protein product [Cunninghamella echinulata]